MPWGGYWRGLLTDAAKDVGMVQRCDKCPAVRQLRRPDRTDRTEVMGSQQRDRLKPRAQQPRSRGDESRYWRREHHSLQRNRAAWEELRDLVLPDGLHVRVLRTRDVEVGPHDQTLRLQHAYGFSGKLSFQFGVEDRREHGEQSRHIKAAVGQWQISRIAAEQAHTNRTEFPCSGKDRKSTRLNSSHGYISYAVFCLKKKKKSRLKNTSDQH